MLTFEVCTCFFMAYLLLLLLLFDQSILLSKYNIFQR